MAVVSKRSDDDMKLVVDAARAAVEQEFQIAERLDAKARNQMTVAGAWFAVVQAFAGLTLRVLIDEPSEHEWLFATIVVLAGAAGLAFIVAMFFSYRVWRLHQESEITHQGINEMVEVAHDGSDELSEKLVQHYGAILARRRRNNKVRATNFKRSIPWWIGGIVATLLELIACLAALAAS